MSKKHVKYPGRPAILDMGDPEWRELWIQQREVKGVKLPPFCVVAYETPDGWVGRRKGVDNTHPCITWLKELFQLAGRVPAADAAKGDRVSGNTEEDE